MRHLRRTVVVFVLCGAAFFGWAQVARADTISVNTTTDASPTDTECSGVTDDCSLRQAIDFANRAGDNTATIEIPAGTYTLTIPSSSCDGQLDYCGSLGIGNGVTIIGEGTASVVITADYPAFDNRLMFVEGETTNVDIEDVTFADGYDEDQSGGALMVDSDAQASLEDVAFSGNTAAGGGALVVESYGSVTATDVTFDGNQSTNGDGGAILVNNSASVELDQATVVNNGGGTDVGAIENDGGTATLYSVTMNGNAGSDLDTLGTTNIQNSIIADGCSGDDDPNSQGNNIFPSDTCLLEATDGDIPDGVPGLSALADNGGPTETEALLSTSDAIGNGSDCDDEDQRHIDRGGTCDIGSYAAGVQFSGTSGTVFTASFSDTEESCPSSATIDWGDGSAVDDATVSCGSSVDDSVPVTISGTHTYAAAGYYHLVAAEPSFGVSIAGSATIAQGSTIVVNTTADTAPFERECSGQDGDCSLREAIDYASSGDTIELPAGTYTLTLSTDDCDGQFDYCGALGIDENVTIVGTGDTSADVVITADYSTFDDRLLDVDGDATSADLQNLTLEGGDFEESYGGALLAENDAEVSLEDVTFSGNTAYGGGAIAATGESSVSGDGVTFDGNMTTSGDGAAILVEGGEVSLENATIVNNGSDDDVGAVDDDDGSLSLTSVTMNGNAGSDLDIGDASASIENSIVADGCSGDNANSYGYNIFPTDSCNFEATDGDIPDGVPGLAALADNGGPTETEALLSTSDAIGNGSDCESGDQRHALRGNTCDIGAFAAGIQFSGTAETALTANFTESAASCPSSGTIDWGDGTPSTDATVSCAARVGDFIPVTVTGTHTYSAAGYYNLLATLDSGDSIAGAATIAQAAASPPPPPPAKQSAPAVGGLSFTGITATTVIVNGSANPNGAPTSYVVNYGTTTAYGQQVGAVSIGSGTGTVALSRPLSGLLPGTTYHVEIVATNSGGSTASADATFTTAATTATLPPPVPGQTFNVLPFSGTVLINGQPLVAGEQIPFGSIIDATKGTVTLQVVGPNGDIQTASFFGAVFQVTQTATGGIQLALTGGDFSVCKVKKTRTTAAVDAKPKPSPKGKSNLSTLPNTKVIRSLWGNGHGSFTTKGRYAAATVRGTVWRTSDRCDGTNITVAEGIISVLDLVTNKTVVVHAPHQFLAKP